MIVLIDTVDCTVNLLLLLPYKINPKIDINEELIAHDRFELSGIVWHEGPSTNSGHYTSNVKLDRRWFYTNDTTVTEGLKKYVPRSMVVSYILVYKKKNNMVVPVSSALTTRSNSSRSKLNPELMNKYNVLKELNTKKVFLATATKRKADEINDTSDKVSRKKDKKNNVNDKKKVEKENHNEVKYNFVKKKSKFTNKSSRERVAKHRSTDEGREKHGADERNRMSELCKTPEGKEKYRADERSRMSKLLKTPERKDINRERVGKLLETPEGREKIRERVAKTRDTDKGIEKHCADERSKISKTRKVDKNSIEKAFI